LRARIKELQTTISDGVVALEIRTRSARVQALQKRWDYLRAGLEMVLDQRGADMADLPGGASGLLGRDYKGKELLFPAVPSLISQTMKGWGA
jgi:hypothetical protein